MVKTNEIEDVKAFANDGIQYYLSKNIELIPNNYLLTLSDVNSALPFPPTTCKDLTDNKKTISPKDICIMEATSLHYLGSLSNQLIALKQYAYKNLKDTEELTVDIPIIDETPGHWILATLTFTKNEIKGGIIWDSLQESPNSTARHETIINTINTIYKDLPKITKQQITYAPTGAQNNDDYTCGDRILQQMCNHLRSKGLSLSIEQYSQSITDPLALRKETIKNVIANDHTLNGYDATSIEIVKEGFKIHKKPEIKKEEHKKVEPKKEVPTEQKKEDTKEKELALLSSPDMTKQIKKYLYTMNEIRFAVKADLINLGIEQEHPLLYDADDLKKQEKKYKQNQAKAKEIINQGNPEHKTTDRAKEGSVKTAIELDKKKKQEECAILLQNDSLYSKKNKTFSIITTSLEVSLKDQFYGVLLKKTLGQIKDWQDNKTPKLKNHTVLFPYNTVENCKDCGHWVTVAIELLFNDSQQLTSTQIKVYNSLGTCGNTSTILNPESIQNCIKSAFNLNEALTLKDEIEHIKSKQQQIGGTDCGPITAHNIINLINGESVGTFNDKKYPEGAFDLRLKQINSIVSNNIYPDFYKSELITNYSTNQEQWDTYAQNLRKQKSKKQSTENNALFKKEEKTKVDSIYTIDKDGKLTLNEKNLNKETAEKLVAELEKQPEQLKTINTIDLRNCKIDYEAARIIYECWYNKIAVTKNNDGSVTLHSEKTLNINPTLDTIQARSEELIKQQDKNGTSTFQDEIIQLTNDRLQISENIHDDPSKDTLPSTAKQNDTVKNASPTSTTSTNNDNKNIANMGQQQLTQQPSNPTNIPPTTQPTNNGTTSTLPNKELASYIQQSLELQILISESLKTAFDRKLAIRNQELKKQKLAAITLGKLYQDFAEQYADEKNAKKDLNNFVETYFNDPQHHNEDVKAVNAAVRSLALLRALESSEKLTSYGFTVDFDKDKSGDYALKVSENGKALWTVTEASKPNKRIIPTQSITTLDPDFLRTFYDLKGDKNSTSDEKREKYLTAYILRKGNVTSKLNDYQDISAQNDKACYFIKELIKFYDKNKDKKEIADSGFQIDKESRKSWDKHIYLPKSNRLLSLFKRAPLTQPGEHLIEAPTVTVA